VKSKTESRQGKHILQKVNKQQAVFKGFSAEFLLLHPLIAVSGSRILAVQYKLKIEPWEKTGRFWNSRLRFFAPFYIGKQNGCLR